MTLKGINSDNLNDWFAAHIEQAKPPLEFSLITGGHSNLTFRVEDSQGRNFVLRRPPTGAVIATAHDMEREHRIISALAPTSVPVPIALGLCEDESVNEAPFYVMDFVEGYVLTDANITAEKFDRAARRQIGEEVIRVLADLHRVVPSEVGLGNLGREEAYIPRQLKRWKTQWEKTKTRELPVMDEVYDGLQSGVPEQQAAGIVHGDFRLGNMLTSSTGRVAAVLDWELCTLGDPMADLGYIMNNWNHEDEETPVAGSATGFPTSAGGFPDREEFVARYQAETGFDVSRIEYYRAFQYWRLAAIVEGVLSRYMKGVMGADADTNAFRAQVDGLAAAAHQRLAEV
ncbi:phosphotransferase family protein [Myxococcota bacterium]|nr:phosphotransferase family protein [Myxococcota bacterium]